MIPIPYSEAVPSDPNRKQYLVLVLENGLQYKGEFSDLRIQRDTIPEGTVAYDLRDADCSGDICQVQPFVLVNHFGTFITETPIPNIEEGPLVKEWWFSYE